MSKKNTISYNAYTAAVNILNDQDFNANATTIKTAFAEYGIPETTQSVVRLIGLMVYRRGGELRMSDIAHFRKLLREGDWATADLKHKEAKAPKESKTEIAKRQAGAEAVRAFINHKRDVWLSLVNHGKMSVQEYEAKMAELESND